MSMKTRVKEANQALHARANPLLFEQDNSFNPSWLIIIVLLLVSIGLIVAGAVVAIVAGTPIPIVAGLAFLVTTINIFAIVAVSQNKKKMEILARATAPGSAGRAVAGVGRFGGSTEPWDDDEPFDYR